MNETLTRGQSIVLMGLIAKSKEKLDQTNNGVRVKELADLLNKSRSSIRASLNQLSKEGLVISKAPKTKLQSSDEFDPREKVWVLQISLDEKGITGLIRKYPEIKEQIDLEEIEQLTDVNIELQYESLTNESNIREIENQIISLLHTTISPDYKTALSLHQSYVQDEDCKIYVYTPFDENVHTLPNDSQIPANPQVAGVGLVGSYGNKELNQLFSDLGLSFGTGINENSPEWLQERYEGDRVSEENVIEDLPNGLSELPISLIELIAVDPNHQGEGIGFEIISEIYADFKSNLPLYVIVWEQESFQKMLDKLDAECVAEYNKAMHPDWRCVRCGLNNKCTCGIYIYKLTEDNIPTY